MAWAGRNEDNHEVSGNQESFFAAPALLFAGVIAMKFGWKGTTNLDWMSRR